MLAGVICFLDELEADAICVLQLSFSLSRRPRSTTAILRYCASGQVGYICDTVVDINPTMVVSQHDDRTCSQSVERVSRRHFPVSDHQHDHSWTILPHVLYLLCIHYNRAVSAAQLWAGSRGKRMVPGLANFPQDKHTSVPTAAVSCPSSGLTRHRHGSVKIWPVLRMTLG